MVMGVEIDFWSAEQINGEALQVFKMFFVLAAVRGEVKAVGIATEDTEGVGRFCVWERSANVVVVGEMTVSQIGIGRL
jgi:hypothetical protein